MKYGTDVNDGHIVEKSNVINLINVLPLSKQKLDNLNKETCQSLKI